MDGGDAGTDAQDGAVDAATDMPPGSLVISSSTYDNSLGAIATLHAGTTLAGTADAGAVATAANDYVHVWGNETPDPSFGVTSEITLTDVDTTTGLVNSTIAVPTNQVVTSFSSKSELGLHYVTDSSGGHLVFVAYAGAGVGALDVSNSDAVPGQDPSNPVTVAFGSSYAFHRTIVSMDRQGTLTYTPTIAYGGNNGRSAILGSNGLFYMVGNANNGNATAFGSDAAANGTNPDVTETTGLEVVTPINGATSSVTIPTGNSAEVSPLVQYTFTDGGKADKPGKDDNYRGITEFGGALYFTKGSGSNGMDTVYTVSSLPTVSNAASATISVVPGFPTDSAKATGGNFTPFAVFFANATTMYVTDEGTGNATDVSSQCAGLEKWSLVTPDGGGAGHLAARLRADQRSDRDGRQQPGGRRRHGRRWHRRTVADRDDHRSAEPHRGRRHGGGHRDALGDDVDFEHLGRQRRRSEQGRNDHRHHRGDDGRRRLERVLQHARGPDLRHRLPRCRSRRLITAHRQRSLRARCVGAQQRWLGAPPRDVAVEPCSYRVACGALPWWCGASRSCSLRARPAQFRPHVSSIPELSAQTLARTKKRFVALSHRASATTRSSRGPARRSSSGWRPVSPAASSLT